MGLIWGHWLWETGSPTVRMASRLVESQTGVPRGGATASASEVRPGEGPGGGRVLGAGHGIVKGGKVPGGQGGAPPQGQHPQ